MTTIIIQVLFIRQYACRIPPSSSQVAALRQPDEEWALVVSYLTLMLEAAPQREYHLRAVFNALCWLVRTGAPWRMFPQDFPPWAAV